ncbi:discoidin domain-containing protein [Archangium violaceum]|uniref:discoidin domain-containing protein n=1 Tax=Archangium violaceum TaxID=83451 RepID=UPI00193C3C59|nr:discoidin domain-containing protein [Archangium violaceum]QRK13159.1 discoidin domain-containing protein [Archangium violaceum]
MLAVLGLVLINPYRASAQLQPRKETVTLLGQKAKVWASSTLKAKDPRRYSVLNAFDGKLATAWVEGAAGMGYGESITIEFPRPVTLSGFWLVPGYTKSLEVFLQNLAPDRMVLSVDGREVGQYTLRYVVDMDEQAPDPTCLLVKDETSLSPRLVVFPQPVSGQNIQLTFRGNAPRSRWTRYDDLAVSEWGLLSEESTHKSARPPAQVATAAALLLGYSRSEKLPRNLFDESTEVQDVLAPSPLISADWMQQGIRQELLRKGADETKPPLENFETIARGALIGAPVTVVSRPDDELQLVGSQLFSFGDGEWIEYYPSITLEGKKSIRWVGAFMSGDGAPGCHDLLPGKLSLMR